MRLCYIELKSETTVTHRKGKEGMAEYFYKEGDEFKKVEDTLLTQTDVDKVVESRLERDRKKFADYDELKEKAAKVETISKDFEDKLKAKDTEKSELEKQLGAAKLETEKVKIVGEFKLSKELEEFVTGDSADDMRAKAEKLSKGVKGGDLEIDKKTKPGEKTSDSKKLAKSLFGKSGE